MQNTFARRWAQLSRSPPKTISISAPAIGAAGSALPGDAVSGSAPVNAVAYAVAGMPDIVCNILDGASAIFVSPDHRYCGVCWQWGIELNAQEVHAVAFREMCDRQHD